MNQKEIGVVRAVFEVLGIVLVRFRPAPRVWGAWLVAVNSASLLFLGRVEAQVTLGAVAVALLGQALIYQRKRFIRVLGITHVVWVPMLAWIALRLETIPQAESALRAWLVVLVATNAISLSIDAWDAMRFLLGERQPYYAW